jgi:hypothetical protein
MTKLCSLILPNMYMEVQKQVLELILGQVRAYKAHIIMGLTNE